MTTPAWQTDDLAEEWVEASSHGTSTSSVSVTEVIGSLRSSSSIQPAEKETNDSATGTAAIRDESPAPAGTFLVREEVEAVPFLPKTPGKAKVGGFANMFTPLALERMFDPPSPRANGQKLPVVTPGPSRKSPLTRSNIGTGATLPAHPSPLSQAHAPVPAVHITPDASCHSVESDSTTCERPEPGDANNNHLPTSQFTFTIPAPTSQSQLLTSSTVQAQSTPGPSRLPSGQQAYPSGYNAMLTPGIFAVNNTPAANPKLRLFQLQYDTFTREHLSAMADSIAVGSPSTSLPDSSLGIQSPSFPYALSRVTETSESPSILRMRATKRLKLSPNVDSSGAMSFATSGDQSHHFVRDQSSGFSRGTYGEGEGEGAVITRPKSPGHLQNKPPKFPMVGPKPILKRDYVRESRNLMQQIKSARDLSTSSSAASDGDVSPGNTSTRPRKTASPPLENTGRVEQHPPAVGNIDCQLPKSQASSVTTKTSVLYRKEAQDLMAQIRKNSRRMISPATTVNEVMNIGAQHKVDDKNASPADSLYALSAPHILGKDNVNNEHGQISRSSSIDTVSTQEGLPAGGSVVRTSSSSTIPGLVFTSRNQNAQPTATNASQLPPASATAPADQPQLSRKRSRLSMDPDEVMQADLLRGIGALSVQSPPTVTHENASGSLDTSPTLSAFPLPPLPPQLHVASEGIMNGQPPVEFVHGNTGRRFLAPSGTNAPAYPTASLRARATEDMGRFVSSSTTTSGHTATTVVSTVGSFVKHAGPVHAVAVGEEPTLQLGQPRRAITQITPQDVGEIPDRVGRMVFDRTAMRWVREGDGAPGTNTVGADGTSDDPFRDIESLRDERSGHRSGWISREEPQEVAQPLAPHPEESYMSDPDAPDAEEAELNSFSFGDAGIAPVVHAVTSVVVVDETFDRTTDTEDDPHDFLEMTGSTSTEVPKAEYAAPDPSSEIEPVPWRSGLLHPLDNSTMELAPVAPVNLRPPPPAPTVGAVIPPTPVIRPAIKSATVTPISALRNPNRRATPATTKSVLAHRRSVSFSDGKREGPIMGLRLSGDGGTESVDLDQSEGISEVLAGLSSEGPTTIQPSARTQRITKMLDDLEDDAFDSDNPTETAPLPQSASQDAETLPVRRPSTGPASASTSGGTRHALSRSNATALSRNNTGTKKPDGTFLTECSFGVAHDRLVQVITDVQPFEPHWEALAAIELNGRSLESVARLKEFLPKLDSLSLNNNKITYLSGVPETIRMLSVANNMLTGLTSFAHLLNIENLDISHNEIDSLRQLECLRHLRELRADGNIITSLDGLQKMDGLIKLSLHGNRVRSIDLSEYDWSRLEMLNISANRLEKIEELASLPSLIALNLDHNNLTVLQPGGPMPKLRILRVSSNRLQRLNSAPFPSLRTLYADNNALLSLDKANKLSKLENLSLRNQGGKGLKLSLKDVRDVKRLYLSGNPMANDFMQDACYNLIYLELAACRLTSLPPKFSALVPNLRVLNLNYNFLKDIKPLEGLARLKKLTIIGSRLTGTKALIRCVKGMPDVEMLDFRMNPCTLGWYLPLLVRDLPGALQPSEGRDGAGRTSADAAGSKSSGKSSVDSWQALDAKFRRDLPDETYVGRLAYRGLVMRSCANIRLLDGVDVTDKEKEKASRLLVGIMNKQQQQQPPAVASAVRVLGP